MKANMKYCPHCNKEGQLHEFTRWYLFSVYYYTCDICKLVWLHKRKNHSLVFVDYDKSRKLGIEIK